MIIVEGPDGAGKSILAKRIADRLQYKYIHGTHKDPSTLDWYLHTIQAGTVIDRTYISEVIYSKVLGRKCRVSEADVRIIERMIQRTTILYVTAPVELLLQRAFTRGETFITKEQLVQIAEEYERYFTYRYGVFNILKIEPHLVVNNDY